MNGSTGSACPWVTCTLMPLWSGSRWAHWSTTMGQPEMTVTPATVSSFGSWSAKSIAVMAPCENPERTNFPMGRSPNSALVSRRSVSMRLRHSTRPSGSSRMSRAMPSAPWARAPIHCMRSKCHQQEAPAAPTGACGKTQPIFRWAMPGWLLAIEGMSTKSLLEAPNPWSMTMTMSTGPWPPPVTTHWYPPSTASRGPPPPEAPAPGAGSEAAASRACASLALTRRSDFSMQSA
mmetsp:Transcript_691/g.2196  ORF Transcript_691/g.2196 Transcript_691/m.2196 type:complete len:234 (+) Transcript_691:215-916(+)